MNFKEAYKSMEEGKIVRRKSWGKNVFTKFVYKYKTLFTSVEDALA